MVIEVVKLAAAPEQIVVEGMLIAMVGFTAAFTVILMAFELALLAVTQDKLLVIIQVTTSPLFNVVEAKKSLLVPTLIPFTFH